MPGLPALQVALVWQPAPSQEEASWSCQYGIGKVQRHNKQMYTRCSLIWPWRQYIPILHKLYVGLMSKHIRIESMTTTLSLIASVHAVGRSIYKKPLGKQHSSLSQLFNHCTLQRWSQTPVSFSVISSLYTPEPEMEPDSSHFLNYFINVHSRDGARLQSPVSFSVISSLYTPEIEPSTQVCLSVVSSLYTPEMEPDSSLFLTQSLW
jgi:hypothetical protein